MVGVRQADALIKNHVPKNIFFDNAGEIFFAVKDNDIKLIVTGFTPRGTTCYAWEGFSDEVLGKASGYGYDKQSTVLVEALEKLFGVRIKGAGAGSQTVCRNAAEHGIRLVKAMDLAWQSINEKE